MIKFVIDSTACVSKEYAQENDVKVVNLSVELDGVREEEGFEDNWTSFYERLKATKSFPKTSQPTPHTFTSAYDEILSKNKNAKIIVITLSESLSGTYNSALLSCEGYEGKVFVIDSGQTSYSQFVLLQELVDYSKTNDDIEKVVEYAKILKEKMSIHFIPQTMEYLKRGGRINLLSATIAGLLQIKPILTFKAGKLTSPKKLLGMQKAITELVNEVPKMFKRLCVFYIHESEWVSKLINMLNTKFDLNISTAHKVSPVIGSHIGIGAVGLAYISQ